MSEDDRWTEVIDQVLEALDNGGLDDPTARDALAEGVRQALSSLETGIGLDVQILGEGFPSTDSEAEPVEVVDGGRGPDEPRSEGNTPSLRVADTDELPRETPSIFTHFKVNRPPKPARTRPLPGLAEAGWIHVVASDAPETAWQTIYHGTRPRLYRVACSTGNLDVTADGEAIERLSPGQSIDVEATAIRVTTTEATDTIGGYTPIRDFDGTEE
jgi:hypothetical protein